MSEMALAESSSAFCETYSGVACDLPVRGSPDSRGPDSRAKPDDVPCALLEVSMATGEVGSDAVYIVACDHASSLLAYMVWRSPAAA